MKLTHTLLNFALCSMMAMSISGQDSRKTATPKQDKSQVHIRYDRFKDSTTVSINPMHVGTFTNGYGNPFYKLSIGAAYSYSGRQARKPDLIAIKFYSSSRGALFAKDRSRELNVIADGERIPFGQLARGDSQVSDGKIVESLTAPMPIGIFRRLVNAKKLEMRLGNYPLDIKEKYVQALRELADSIDRQ